MFANLNRVRRNKTKSKSVFGCRLKDRQRMRDWLSTASGKWVQKIEKVRKERS